MADGNPGRATDAAPPAGGARRRPATTLRVRLLVLVALAAAPAFVLVLQSGALARETALARADDAAVRLAQLAAVQGNQVLSDAAPYVAALARLPALVDGGPAEQSRLLAEVLKEVPHCANAGLIGRDGRVIASALPFAPGTDLSDRDYFRQALATGGASLGRCQFGRITREPSMNMATVVRDASGEIRAVVFVALRLDWVLRFAVQAKLPADAVVAVFDDEGTVAARFPDPEKLTRAKLPDAPLVRAVLATGEGHAKLEGLAGTVRPYAWTPLRWGSVGTGSYVAVGVSAEREIAEADLAQTRSLLALGAAACLAFVVAWIAGDFLVVRRVRSLARVTERLATGELGARAGPPYAGGEIGDVERSFDAMAAALEERDADLQRAEARWRSLVEQTPAVFYTSRTDSAARTVFVGPGVEALLGFTADEWRADPQLWSKRLLGEDKVRVALEYGRAVAAGGSFAMEYRLRGRDGRPVEVRDSGTVRRGDDGTPLVTGVLVDVTEVKELHARLLRERQLDAAARLASAVARDVDDAAAAVRRHAVALQPKLHADAVAKGHLDGALRALERVAALTGRLRAFGGGLALEPETVDAQGALERLLPEFRRIAGEGTEVVVLPVPGETLVRADARQLDETLLRMAALAKKAMGRGGHLVAGTAVIAIDEDEARRRVGAVPGNYVVAFAGEAGAAAGGGAAAAPWIIDLGAGAAPAAREASLELAAVLGFALQSGGYADVVSAPGKGTTYRLFLPQARAAPDGAARAG